MFAQMRERFNALKEFHAVRGLHWRLPSRVWSLIGYFWCGGLGQLAFRVIVPGLNHRPLFAELRTILEVNLFLSLAVVFVFTIINACHNVPAIIAFLRDPTFENE